MCNENNTVPLPIEPSLGVLQSMAMTYRHDFGLDKLIDSPLDSGMTPEERKNLLVTMKQLYTEIVRYTRSAQM